MTAAFVIIGAPRTKKTHNRIFRRKGVKHPVVMPSEAHETWSAVALPQVRLLRGDIARQLGMLLPLERAVNVAAAFYRDAERGDAVGYYQALADLLELSGVVSNDSLIRSWDGSRLLKDAARPRIEVRLEVET